jgi:uncharacterized protein (DUF302 family)
MKSLQVPMRRLGFVSTRPFADVVARVGATIGQPDITAFRRALAAARTLAELQSEVDAAVGASGLMEFARFDAGEVLRKEIGGDGPRLLRLLVGNPLIMKDMARTVPDAAAYAPVTILIDQRADGVHLTYDSMESLLAPYGDEPALTTARMLDAKIGRLLEAAAMDEPGARPV